MTESHGEDNTTPVQIAYMASYGIGRLSMYYCY